MRKILSWLPSFIAEYVEWIFFDASENQIRIAKLKKNEFRSYTQLKKRQRKARKFFAGFFLVVVSLFVGLLLGPTLLPQFIESEVYIPNGKGDILLGNISKNQVTVIFKTLDSANENKPLATRAVVEIYKDEQLSKLVRRTNEDEYAVTHIIPVDDLQENNIYYVRITATDSSSQPHSKTVSSWGNGSDPIKVYTSGELIAACVPASNVQLAEGKNGSESSAGLEVPILIATDGLQNFDDSKYVEKIDNSVLHISRVQNENYLQPKNKVQTIISWDTNLPSSTILIYGEGNAGEKKEVVINTQQQTRHAAILTTLNAGTTYYFKTKSISGDGQTALSEEYSLRTPRPKENVLEKIVDNFKGIIFQVKPN